MLKKVFLFLLCLIKSPNFFLVPICLSEFSHSPTVTKAQNAMLNQNCYYYHSESF